MAGGKRANAGRKKLSFPTKVPKEVYLQIKELWEKNADSNRGIARRFEEYNVTEKNIRNWAERYDWIRERKPRVRIGRPPKAVVETYMREGVKPGEKRPHTTGPRKEPEPEKSFDEYCPEDVVITSNGIEYGFVEVERFIDIIVEMVVSGHRKRSIYLYFKNKYNLSRKVFDRVYTMAMETLVKSIEKNMEARYAFHIEARLRMFRKFEESGKYESAMGVLIDLAKLEGMYQKEPTVNIVNVSNENKVIKLKLPEEYKEIEHMAEEVSGKKVID